MSGSGRGWRRGVGAVIVQAGVWFLVAVTVRAATTGVCREPATAAGLLHGRVALAVLVAAGCVPWLVLAVVRRRAWPVLAGLVATGPAAVVLALALMSSAADWSSTWCLF